mgnify:CR=1 FL=1
MKGLFLVVFISISTAFNALSQEETEYNPEAKLLALGIELSQPSAPMANYVNAVRTGNLIFLAGKGPTRANGENITGKLGADLTIEEGYEAARITAINQISVLKAELGDLKKVKRILLIFWIKPSAESVLPKRKNKPS